MSTFKPLLAETITDFDALKYPVVISPKMDGIRAINLGDGLISRKIKAIPNAHTQRLFGSPALQWFDGELICGDPTDKDVYNNTYRAVMARTGAFDVRYFIFDHVQYPGEGFMNRLRFLPKPLPPNCVLVEQRLVSTAEDLLKWEEHYLAQGYEGVMVRDPHGRYKYGRSTEREGILLKLKRFSDDDCEIIGAEEQLSNQNEATMDALGHTKRSSHKENKVPSGVLGALIVKDLVTRVVFNIGTGFDLETRAQMWADHTGHPVTYTLNEESYTATPSGAPLVGRLGKYKHFKVGVVEKPRFPVWLGYRDPIDTGVPL